MELDVSLTFLSQLGSNNNREWFEDHRDLYKKAKGEFESFIEFLIPVVKQIDPGVDVSGAKECIFRIFRDVRFSKNKAPYKTNFGAYIARGGRKSPFAGYYVHMEPGNSFAGGGIYMPESGVLQAIRMHIFEHAKEYRAIIGGKTFRRLFGNVWGDKLKTAPRGFPKDSPDIDLVRNKSYAVMASIPDEWWTSGRLVGELKQIFSAQLPFNRFLNRAVSRL